MLLNVNKTSDQKLGKNKSEFFLFYISIYFATLFWLKTGFVCKTLLQVKWCHSDNSKLLELLDAFKAEGLALQKV